MSVCAGDKMSYTRATARPSKRNISNKRKGFVSSFNARRELKAKGEPIDQRLFRVARSRFNRIVV